MKHLKFLSVVILFLSVNFAGAQTVLDKWSELKAFHEVLSATFHPSEKGDLQPIKARYQELALKAEAVYKSEIPAEFRTKETLVATEKLQITSKQLLKKIASKADDAAIMKQLAEVHDAFHEIVGLCSAEKH